MTDTKQNLNEADNRAASLWEKTEQERQFEQSMTELDQLREETEQARQRIRDVAGKIAVD